jgi:hypothetical protein
MALIDADQTEIIKLAKRVGFYVRKDRRTPFYQIHHGPDSCVPLISGSLTQDQKRCLVAIRLAVTSQKVRAECNELSQKRDDLEYQYCCLIDRQKYLLSKICDIEKLAIAADQERQREIMFNQSKMISVIYDRCKLSKKILELHARCSGNLKLAL